MMGHNPLKVGPYSDYVQEDEAMSARLDQALQSALPKKEAVQRTRAAVAEESARLLSGRGFTEVEEPRPGYQCDFCERFVGKEKGQMAIQHHLFTFSGRKGHPDHPWRPQDYPPPPQHAEVSAGLPVLAGRGFSEEHAGYRCDYCKKFFPKDKGEKAPEMHLKNKAGLDNHPPLDPLSSSSSSSSSSNTTLVMGS